MRFLTRTFRNVLYVCVGKLIVCSARKQSFEELAVRRKLEDAGYAAAPRTRPAGTQTEHPNLKQRPPQALFCLKLYNSCCYARYSCGNNCNVVVKLVQDYHCFFIRFISILRKQFAANDTFLREANSYK